MNTSTPTNPTEAALADRLELAAQGINDAFVVSRWTDAQRVADQLRAAAADLRSIPQARGMDCLAKLEHKWRMNAGDYTIDCAWRQMYGEVADELEAALRAAPSADMQGVHVFSCRRCPVSVESRWIEPECPECGDPCELDTSAKPAATPPQPAGAVDDARYTEALRQANYRGYETVADLIVGYDRIHSATTAALEAARIGGVRVPDAKPLPEVMMAEYHEARGWNACRDAMLAAAPSPTPGVWEKSTYRVPRHLVRRGDEVTGCDCAATMDHSIGYEVATEPTPPVEASGRDAVSVKRWPFVESPGEFADRLAQALRDFPMIGAVRCVLIEEPPTLAADYLALATPSDEPKGDGNG